MTVTYEKLKTLVPKETKEFISTLLPYLDAFVRNDRILKFRGTDDTPSNQYSLGFFLALYAFSMNKENASFLGQYGFDNSRYLFGNKEKIPFLEKAEDLYEKNSYFIPDYKDELDYQSLFPEDLLERFCQQYMNHCHYDIFNSLFPHNENITQFQTRLQNRAREKRLAQEQQLEQELYKDLSIDIVSYLEIASKIRTILKQQNLENGYQDIMKNREEDITSLALFLALYYYKDAKVEDDVISYQGVLKEVLEEKGLTLDKIYHQLNFTISSRDIQDTKRNLFAIQTYFQKYCETKNKEISMTKIISRLFDRNFTGSLAIERLMTKLNCYVGMFDSLEELIEEKKEEKRKTLSAQYVQSFYTNLSKEGKEFIEFSAKIYQILLEKMKKKEHNQEILRDEDDADTLALFLATYYFNGDVSTFFKDYGITLEKIFKLLKIEIHKEEIESFKLNEKTLVDRYKRFVYDGVNRNRQAQNIQINDIAHNLCSREFNKSMIMEDIFHELVKNQSLQSDFLSQLQQHLEQKEAERKIQLTQKLFHDMPVSTMEYLENASRIHENLRGRIKGYQEADLIVFSLLLAIYSTNSEVKGFFAELGITSQSIYEYLEINRNLESGSPSIDLLTKEYGEYIFGGYNQGVERKDLTIYAISRNIFSKELNNSVFISKFLDHFHISYDTFLDYDQKYQEYQVKTEERRKEEQAKKFVLQYNSEVSRYLERTFKIYCGAMKKKKDQSLKLEKEEDIKEFALVASLLRTETDASRFFQKNHVTLEKVLEAAGLKLEDITRFEQENPDYLLATTTYRPYLERDFSQYQSNRKIAEIVKRIFEPETNDSLFLENVLCQVGGNYDILKEEVSSGRDYELSLTIDDRISLLAQEPIEELDPKNMRSVLHFGNSLAVHSRYIHDELPKLVLSDVHEKSLATIQDILGRVYQKQEVEPPKRSFWSRLFAIDVTSEEPKVVFNASAIQELKDAIEQNITVLSQELLGYDEIRKYIEVYRRKNRSHYLVAREMEEELKTSLAHLDPKKEEEYATFLEQSSLIQIMGDKKNRFATTNQIMQQELFKINQAIVNHFITINALEMARDDLLPLIGSELAIYQGRDTENKALEVSQSVIGLLQSLLTRNVDTAVQNMEQLKQASLPEEVFASLNKDIRVYLEGINQASTMISKVESLDIDKISLEEPEPISLETGEETPKQKKLEKPKQ